MTCFYPSSGEGAALLPISRDIVGHLEALKITPARRCKTRVSGIGHLRECSPLRVLDGDSHP